MRRTSAPVGDASDGAGTHDDAAAPARLRVSRARRGAVALSAAASRRRAGRRFDLACQGRRRAQVADPDRRTRARRGRRFASSSADDPRHQGGASAWRTSSTPVAGRRRWRARPARAWRPPELRGRSDRVWSSTYARNGGGFACRGRDRTRARAGPREHRRSPSVDRHIAAPSTRRIARGRARRLRCSSAWAMAAAPATRATMRSSTSPALPSARSCAST